MNQRKTTVALLAALALGSSLTLVVERVRAAGAPTSRALTYTGYLTSTDGTPVDGSMSVALAIFAEASGGTALCEVGGPRVEVEDGNFQLPLPDECTAAVQSNPDLWIEVAVSGSPVGRTKLGAVPYAVEASHAEKAEQAAWADIAGSATRAGEALALTNDALFTTTDCTYADGHTDCLCPEDAAVLSGGACATFDCVRETAVTLAGTPLDRRTWRIECRNQAGAALSCPDAYATCLRVR
jgi:hypothetical protein